MGPNSTGSGEASIASNEIPHSAVNAAGSSMPLGQVVKPSKITSGKLEDLPGSSSLHLAGRQFPDPASRTDPSSESDPQGDIDTEGLTSRIEENLSVALVGSLYVTILKFYAGVAREVSQTRKSRRLHSELKRLFLWGDSYSVAEGHLNGRLSRSPELRQNVLSVLYGLGKVIKDELVGVTDILNKSPQPGGTTGSSLSNLVQSDIYLKLEQLLRRAATATGVAEAVPEPESPSDDGSIVSYYMEDVMDDVAAYIDCLMDLSVALDSPSFNSGPDVGPLEETKAIGFASSKEMLSHEYGITVLQSVARGMLLRHQIFTLLMDFDEEENPIAAVQAVSKAFMVRSKFKEKIRFFHDNIKSMVEIQSFVRTSSKEMFSHEYSTIALQSFARGMLLRYQISALLVDFDEQETSITAVQAVSKAFVVRSKLKERTRFFHDNTKSIVKIQGFIRAKFQKETYMSFMTGKNPPIKAVTNIIRLFNGINPDFHEGVQFEQLRKKAVEQIRQNETWEEYLDQFEIKITLLTKNKITLDEAIGYHQNFPSRSILINSSRPNQLDPKALNKASRAKLKLYQQLLFTLQTQPQYMARLFRRFRRIREEGTSEECNRIERLVMRLFGYAQSQREEYYLLNLIGRSIRQEVDSCYSMENYVSAKPFWVGILGNYIQSAWDNKHLHALLGPLIRHNIIENPTLGIEHKPRYVSRLVIDDEDLRSRLPSNQPLDEEPRIGFRTLREVCDQYLFALEDLLPQVPYSLRFVCQQTFDALGQHFQLEPQEKLLQVVSDWLWCFYLDPAFASPENYGIIENRLSSLQRHNLREVAKVLGQIASGRPFGEEDIYLQPLNVYIGESVERLALIMKKLSSAPDTKSTFQIHDLDEPYAGDKPTLYIHMTDVFAIHNLISRERHYLYLDHDDPLQKVMQDLGNAENNERTMNGISSSYIQMILTPNSPTMEDPQAELKAIFTETKRCICYILRVQTGSSLLDILVKPTSQDDEDRWKMVLQEDFGSGSNRWSAYSNASLVDVTQMSYSDIKRNAIENVILLDHMGYISKDNLYQDVLNAITVDIRSQNRRRIQRQRELEGIRLTLSKLQKKAKDLDLQRRSHDDYIEEAISKRRSKSFKPVVRTVNPKMGKNR